MRTLGSVLLGGRLTIRTFGSGICGLAEFIRTFGLGLRGGQYLYELSVRFCSVGSVYTNFRFGFARWEADYTNLRFGYLRFGGVYSNFRFGFARWAVFLRTFGSVLLGGQCLYELSVRFCSVGSVYTNFRFGFSRPKMLNMRNRVSESPDRLF